jgi:voltage-gated potassium channel
VFVAAIVREGQRIADVDDKNILVKAGDELVLYKSK